MFSRRVGLIFALFVWLCLDEAHAGIGSLLLRWPPNKPIDICFYGGSLQVRKMIANTAREWTDGLSVVFNFGQSDPLNSCEDEKRSYDVRIAFDTPGFYSLIGIDARSVPKDKPP
jgi:hypothetical protein